MNTHQPHKQLKFNQDRLTYAASFAKYDMSHSQINKFVKNLDGIPSRSLSFYRSSKFKTLHSNNTEENNFDNFFKHPNFEKNEPLDKNEFLCSEESEDDEDDEQDESDQVSKRITTQMSDIDGDDLNMQSNQPLYAPIPGMCKVGLFDL